MLNLKCYYRVQPYSLHSVGTSTCTSEGQQAPGPVLCWVSGASWPPGALLLARGSMAVLWKGRHLVTSGPLAVAHEG